MLSLAILNEIDSWPEALHNMYILYVMYDCILSIWFIKER